MTHLHVFMEIDTCPICGGKMYVVDNGYVGEKLIREIPGDTVFEIVSTDPTGTNFTCGKFIVKRRDPVLLDNDWFAEYLPNPRSW